MHAAQQPPSRPVSLGSTASRSSRSVRMIPDPVQYTVGDVFQAVLVADEMRLTHELRELHHTRRAPVGRDVLPDHRRGREVVPVACDEMQRYVGSPEVYLGLVGLRGTLRLSGTT